MSLLHRTLPSIAKQISAITGPHLVPHGNRYHITGTAWSIRTLSVCRLFHSDDDQIDRKCLDSIFYQLLPSSFLLNW